MASAPKYLQCDSLCRLLVEEARKGIFKPVYLLMGEEPFYVDMVSNAIIENCIPEDQRDFNQLILYGADVDADKLVTSARRYPMFAERQLVVLREAQMMKNLDEISVYCENPLESTVLVICMMGARTDKRKALYKNVVKHGVVVDSQEIQSYDMASWVKSYFNSRSLSISDDAAELLIEHTGMNLSKVAAETDKMLQNLPEDLRSKTLTADDIARNVGISRQYSVLELSNALVEHDSARAMKIATVLGASPKFAMPAATALLFGAFNRLLRYHCHIMKYGKPLPREIPSVLGFAPNIAYKYDKAATVYYPIRKVMDIITLLRLYDFKAKGGDSGESNYADQLIELVSRILL